MSLANDPTWSNGDTTATITLKSNYKWSDGQPVTSRDVLFFFDEIKAAINEDPANWGPYSPGVGIPDEVASVTTPNASTVVFTMKQAVNPGWFLDDELSAITPMPAHAWAKASASGPLLDFTISLLKSHGWTINTSGTDTCARAGTGPTDCGAGIPAGTQLAFNLIYTSSPAATGEQCTAFASAAASAGITIHLSSATYNYIITYYDDPVPTGKSYINKWAMEDFGGFTDSTYPTQLGVFNGPGSLNEGDYNNPTANALINASVTSGNPAAVKAEASFLTANQPGLFQPNPDLIAVWKTNISGPTASFASLTQYGLDAEYWWFTG